MKNLVGRIDDACDHGGSMVETQRSRFASGLWVASILLPSPWITASLRAVVLPLLSTVLLVGWMPTLGQGPSVVIQQAPEDEFRQAMQRGTEALQAGDGEAAVAAFERALALKPRDAQALGRLGGSYLTLRRWSEALDALSTAAKLTPDAPRVLYGQGVALAALRRFEEAIPMLERAVQANPGNGRAWMLLGRLLVQQRGSLAALLEAINAYERAFETQPQNANLVLAMMRTYGRLGLLDEALELVEGFAGSSASEIFPIKLEFARLLIELGRFQEAREVLEASIAAGAGIGAHLELAVVARNQADLDDALEVLQRAARLRPELAEVYVRLGDLHVARQDLTAAKTALQRAIELDPEQAEAQSLLGLTLHRLGDAEAAVPYLERSLRLQPENSKAAYNLTLALRDLGRSEASRAMMERFRTLTGEETRSKLAERQTEIALLNSQGLYYYRHGRAQQAVQRFERALELSSSDDLVYLNLGLAHSALADHESAVAAFEQAIELNPRRAQTYAALSSEYRALGRDQDADRIQARLEELSQQ